MGYQWKVGELAVCVIGMSPWIETGSIYPVREVDKELHGLDMTPELPTGGELIRLHGAVTPAGGDYGWWKASRFRPLNEDDYKRIREKCGLDNKVDMAMREFKFGPVNTEVGRWK